MALKKNDIRDMQKNDDCVEKSLKDLASICKEAYRYEDGVMKKDKEVIIKKMFDGEKPLDKKRKAPKHKECDFIKDLNNPKKNINPKNETEKRICRCMYYYGKNPEYCNDCPLKHRWVPGQDSNIKVVNYEWPMPYVVEGVGGIDLLLQEGDVIYAVETKRPEGNKDTISLMFAEIMTYTYECFEKEYVPAIAVFENGFHYRKIKKLIKKNKDFKDIIKYIPVFLIKYKEKDNIATYDIVHWEIDYSKDGN